jgi:hypothetical protein
MVDRFAPDHQFLLPIFNNEVIALIISLAIIIMLPMGSSSTIARSRQRKVEVAMAIALLGRRFFRGLPDTIFIIVWCN